MSKKTRFTVTDQHLKMLRRMNVGWQDCETGAPEINPKRPYGNSSVANDIHEILTGELVGFTGSPRDQLTDEEEQMYLAIHRETETALQIVLSTGMFQAGTYEVSEYRTYWSRVA